MELQCKLIKVIFINSVYFIVEITCINHEVVIYNSSGDHSYMHGMVTYHSSGRSLALTWGGNLPFIREIICIHEVVAYHCQGDRLCQHEVENYHYHGDHFIHLTLQHTNSSEDHLCQHDVVAYHSSGRSLVSTWGGSFLHFEHLSHCTHWVDDAADPNDADAILCALRLYGRRTRLRATCERKYEVKIY